MSVLERLMQTNEQHEHRSLLLDYKLLLDFEQEYGAEVESDDMLQLCLVNYMNNYFVVELTESAAGDSCRYGEIAGKSRVWRTLDHFKQAHAPIASLVDVWLRSPHRRVSI
jgi:hypothetical protein